MLFQRPGCQKGATHPHDTEYSYAGLLAITIFGIVHSTVGAFDTPVSTGDSPEKEQ